MRNVLELLVLASLRSYAAGRLGKNAIESTKSLYDLVVVDSEGIEKSFAESLEAEDDVVYIANCPVDSTSTLRWANIIPTGL